MYFKSNHIKQIKDTDVKNKKLDYLKIKEEFYLKNYPFNKENRELLKPTKEKEHKEIYNILAEKHKRIFDIIEAEKITVSFTEEDVYLLKEILLDNQINFVSDDFKDSTKITFDNNQVTFSSNMLTVNQEGLKFSFEAFLNKINI